MIYLLCFGISAWFAHCAVKSKEKWQVILFSVLSILPTVILAGLRDYSIGIDTHRYLELRRYWSGAIAAGSLGAYMDYYMSLGLGEPLFALMVGIAAHTAGNYTVFLFLSHAIIITCMYIGAYRFRKYASPALVMGLFYLIFYSHSLNITRQYIAMAILFAFLGDIPQKKYLRYSVVVVLTYLIHKSAILGFASVLVHWFLSADADQVAEWIRQKYNSVKEMLGKLLKRKLRYSEPVPAGRLPRALYATVLQREIFVFACLALLVFLFNPMCRLLINIGLLHEKYNYYLNLNEAEHATLNTLFLLVEMVPLIVFREYLQRRCRYYDFFFTLSGSYLILYQLSAFLVYGKRVASYFSLQNLVTLAMIPRIYTDKKRRTIATVLIVGAALVYWLYVYVYRNASQTYPYKWIL